VVEDAYERLQWMDAINKCVPLVSSNTGAAAVGMNTASILKNKIYTFCFRDYVNWEELNAILSRRWGLERLLLRARRCGHLSVDSVKKCRLTEWFAVLGVVPLQIEWDGEIRHDPPADASTSTNPSAIHWTSTRLRLGWKNRWLGKTIANPPVAEKLRQEPWALYVPVANGNGEFNGNSDDMNIVVLHRLGSGNIVYAREECMKTKAN
jgi:hypothetical protein